ncbi:virulence-associated E family protein [Salegentibacter sp. Hel_I_6]|uniref:virulence-associated E family protein n=1 Tax=Salegentibacter sp. Hel_I_6 TaxID=1250278 RepID=UPI001E328735|nr:virulence-associated E family protein [Salegentibacter sp. Hel_I_6]
MEYNSGMYDSGKNSNTKFDQVIAYLNDKYLVRFNIILIQYQIKLKSNGKWEILNLNSLFIELEQAGITISLPKLEILFKSHLIERYNPIGGYFKALPEWDGIDHIKKLCSYIKADDDELLQYHMEKWLTRAVLCSLVDDKVNKQCLVFTSSKQNVGKTTFFRFLAPKELKDYYVEDIGTDKDSLIKLSKNFIINIDELSIQGQGNIKTLKSFISRGSINERLPYGKRQERLERRSNFVASTNEMDFLVDETGNVRWLIFEIFSIDFNYSKIDIDKVWAQAYFNAFKRKNYNPELSTEDILKNEKRNELFLNWTMEKELIVKYLEPGTNEKDFMTATDVIIELRAMGVGLSLSKIKIGKALKMLKFPVARHMGEKRAHGYLVKPKDLSAKNKN